MALDLNKIKGLFVVTEEEPEKKEDSTSKGSEKDKKSGSKEGNEDNSKVTWKTSAQKGSGKDVKGSFNQKIFDSFFLRKKRIN